MLRGDEPTVPRSAFDVFLTIDRPIDGVIDMFPAEPIEAVVTTVSESELVSDKLFALVSVAPLPSSAVAVSVTIAKATEAPRPNLPL